MLSKLKNVSFATTWSKSQRFYQHRTSSGKSTRYSHKQQNQSEKEQFNKHERLHNEYYRYLAFIPIIPISFLTTYVLAETKQDSEEKKVATSHSPSSNKNNQVDWEKAQLIDVTQLTLDIKLLTFQVSQKVSNSWKIQLSKI